MREQKKSLSAGKNSHCSVELEGRLAESSIKNIFNARLKTNG